MPSCDSFQERMEDDGRIFANICRRKRTLRLSRSTAWQRSWRSHSSLAGCGTKYVALLHVWVEAKPAAVIDKSLCVLRSLV